MPAILAQMLTYPDAFQLFGSTPPTTPAHPWTVEILRKAKELGFFAHRTIFDSPRITDEQAYGLMEELGGRAGDLFVVGPVGIHLVLP